MPEDPLPPLYWRNEVSGELSEAVEHYMDARRRLTFREIVVIKAYLRQWADCRAWDAAASMTGGGKQQLAELREKAKRIRTQEDINDCVWAAVELGMDPL